MEASPDALNPHVHDPSRRGSPAVRAAKDITYGSVRRIVFTPSDPQTLWHYLAGCRNSFESL